MTSCLLHSIHIKYIEYIYTEYLLNSRAVDHVFCLISLSSQEEWQRPRRLYLVSIRFTWGTMEICSFILFLYNAAVFLSKKQLLFLIKSKTDHFSHTWIVMSVILQAELGFSIGKHFATATPHNCGHLHQFALWISTANKNDMCKQII